MKYGMRERLSGAIILIALAAIFVPMLFDEPASRDERPEPVLTIEQPAPVERRDLPDPQPPESLGEMLSPQASSGQAESPVASEEEEPDSREAPQVNTAPAVAVEQAESPEATPPTTPPTAEEPRPDPIAELAQAASERLQSRAASAPEQNSAAPSASPGGEWAVQVGSFGEAANAERLQAQLQEQGFPAYSRQRDNAMTTVYVGPFDTSETGERVMGAIKEQVNMQGLLVRVRD